MNRNKTTFKQEWESSTPKERTRFIVGLLFIGAALVGLVTLGIVGLNLVTQTEMDHWFVIGVYLSFLGTLLLIIWTASRERR